ncbi:MAG: glycosyltransferase family 9 protein [Oligoflexia bacterium]|nr:glycosyltransferase family 9 protein [Oligoflexia bacterium]
MSIPFISALIQAKMDFVDSIKIILIVREEYEAILNCLNIRDQFDVITFNKKKYSGFSGPFKFASDYKSLIQDADIYYTLSPSFSTALIGRLIKARTRIGHVSSDFFRGYLLTKEVSYIKKHRAEEYLNLLSTSPTSSSINPNIHINIYANPYIYTNKLIINYDEYFLINATSEAPSRRMPILKWVELISKFINRTFIFTGLKKDYNYIEELIGNLEIANGNRYINLAGKTNLIELMSIVSKAKFVISNDSGVAHLSAMLCRPLLVFFGAGDSNSTSPKIYSEHIDKNFKIIIEKIDVYCSPCLKNQCPIKNNVQNMICLKNINMKKVYSNFF